MEIFKYKIGQKAGATSGDMVTLINIDYFNHRGKLRHASTNMEYWYDLSSIKLYFDKYLIKVKWEVGYDSNKSTT